MQISISFYPASRKQTAVFNAMLKLLTRYTSNIYRIGGDHGLNAADLSWDEAYALASAFISIIRKYGTEVVDGVKIQIGEDDKVSNMDALIDRYSAKPDVQT